MTSVCQRKSRIGDATVQIGSPRASMRPRQGCLRRDKDLPVRQGVEAGGGIGAAIGHAPFVAQAVPIPREKERPAFGRLRRRRPRTASGRPRTMQLSPARSRRDVGRVLPTHAVKTFHPKYRLRRRLIADSQPFAVGTESDVTAGDSAWRLDRLADAAKHRLDADQVANDGELLDLLIRAADNPELDLRIDAPGSSQPPE